MFFSQCLAQAIWSCLFLSVQEPIPYSVCPTTTALTSPHLSCSLCSIFVAGQPCFHSCSILFSSYSGLGKQSTTYVLQSHGLQNSRFVGIAVTGEWWQGMGAHKKQYCEVVWGLCVNIGYGTVFGGVSSNWACVTKS